MAVKANLGNSLTKIVIGVITLITNTIKIVEEFIIFIKYKASKLEVFGVVIIKKVRKSIEVVRQQ